MFSSMIRVWASVVVMWSVASLGIAAELRQVTGTITENDHPVAARLYIEGPPGTFHFARSADTKGTAVAYDVKRSETCREQHVTLSAHPSHESDLFQPEAVSVCASG